jgi:hypothetical protein
MSVIQAGSVLPVRFLVRFWGRLERAAGFPEGLLRRDFGAALWDLRSI